LKSKAVAVQHHHAHVAALMAEHHLEGPVLGVAWDGTGYGTDGTAWGGEFLIARAASCRRVATLRPIPLAGGDQAIRQVWRLAAALLDDAFDGQPPIDRLPLFNRIPAHQLAVVRDMARRSIHAPLSHGAGRYFDAVGAIVLGLSEARYEGEVALRLNIAADPSAHGAYPWSLHQTGSPAEVDLRPAVREIVGDVLAAKPAGLIAARFHDTLAECAAQTVRVIASAHELSGVALTGGCFQNARLAETLAGALSKELAVFLHRTVPPGDGGIALGQVVVANAQLR
jgi:hydrogenase maturation protein HypF